MKHEVIFDSVPGLDGRAAESGNVNLTVGLGLAAMSKIVTGSERNWGHVLLRHLGWKDGQGIGARRKARENEVMDTGPRRLGPTMPTGNELQQYKPGVTKKSRFLYSQLLLLDSAKITIVVVYSRNMASLTKF